jgi:hypothetical protein
MADNNVSRLREGRVREAENQDACRAERSEDQRSRRKTRQQNEATYCKKAPGAGQGDRFERRCCWQSRAAAFELCQETAALR